MRSILGGLLRLLGLRRFVLDVTDCRLTQTSIGMFERSVHLNPDTLRELDLTMASNDFSSANNIRDVANLALINSLESIRIDLSDTHTASLRRDRCRSNNDHMTNGHNVDVFATHHVAGGSSTAVAHTLFLISPR